MSYCLHGGRWLSGYHEVFMVHGGLGCVEGYHTYCKHVVRGKRGGLVQEEPVGGCSSITSYLGAFLCTNRPRWPGVCCCFGGVDKA